MTFKTKFDQNAFLIIYKVYTLEFVTDVGTTLWHDLDKKSYKEVLRNVNIIYDLKF